VKKIGYPLWIPEPTKPRAHQLEGVKIGDVGKITYDGSFNFLFNICLPRDHPINRFAPPTLEPINFDEDRDVITLPNLHPQGFVIASPSIREASETDAELHDRG
jgi:hypothetical protein